MQFNYLLNKTLQDVIVDYADGDGDSISFIIDSNETLKMYHQQD